MKIKGSLATLCLMLMINPLLATISQQPNILILYADDLGLGDLSCYNPDSKIPTPHLDKLAGQGMRFSDAHSSSSICTPSRYALLTGRYHWRDIHDIVNSFEAPVFKPERLTLPEMLRAKGYTTTAIGKWHLGWDWNAIRKPESKSNKEPGPNDFDWSKSIPGGPLAHGFDHYFGDDVINFPPYCWIEDDRVVKAPDTTMDTKEWKAIKEGNWECRPGPMVTGWDPYQNLPEITRRGVQYIHRQKRSQKPFFLYFAFPSPHAPVIPNDEFDGRSKAGAYGDSVVETDDAIGQLLKALAESGEAENTIIIFSSDNGPERYAYERDEKLGHWSSHPLRGLKRDIYEGGHRVPTIIAWPGVTEPGTVSEALVSQIDIMATLAAAIGYDLPANSAEDSHDLLPLLKGDVKALRTTHVHNTNKDHYAIRSGDWVLIEKTGYLTAPNMKWEVRHGYPPNPKDAYELYNMKTDLTQKHNVATENPEKVFELKALLKKIQQQGHSAPRLVR